MLTTVLFATLFLAAVAYTIFDSSQRLPRGGKGLRIGYIPRRLRPAMNRLFARRDWPKPYDDDGNRIAPS